MTPTQKEALKAALEKVREAQFECEGPSDLYESLESIQYSIQEVLEA